MSDPRSIISGVHCDIMTLEKQERQHREDMRRLTLEAYYQVRDVARDNGITIADLARTAGVHPRHIYQCTGKTRRPISKNIVVKMATAVSEILEARKKGAQ